MAEYEFDEEKHAAVMRALEWAEYCEHSMAPQMPGMAVNMRLYRLASAALYAIHQHENAPIHTS